MTAPEPQLKPAPATEIPDAEKAGGDTIAQDGRLSNSIIDAYTLLDFACRKGDAPPQEIGSTLIQSHQKLMKKLPFSPDEEAKFWVAFAQITERIKPVTIESILFTSPALPEQEPGKHKILSRLARHTPPTENVLRHYMVFAIMTLILLLTLLMEWAIGTFIYDDAYKVKTYMMQAQRELLVARQNSDNVAGTPAAQSAELKLAEAKALTEQDQSWNDVSFVRLWWWNRGVSRFIPPYDLTIDTSPAPTSDKAEGNSGVILDSVGLQRLEFTRTELTLQVISNYILVTLFSLLGGVTQALRSISRQVEDVSFTENDLYRVRTRVILGVISGVCMAWLYIISTIPGDTAPHAPLNAVNFFGAFTPWAIAFISGYSVEIFFTLLERVISVVTTKIKGIDATPLETPEPSSQKSPVAVLPASVVTPTVTAAPASNSASAPAPAPVATVA